MASSTKPQPAEKIKISESDFNEFQSTLADEISKLEALFGLMVTSGAELTDSGKRPINPMVYQVGELGLSIVDNLHGRVLDLFESQVVHHG